jgi:hypothetical protein
MRKWLKVLVLITAIGATLTGCTGGGGDSGAVKTPSASKGITTYSFKNTAAMGIINNSAKTISVMVSHGTNVKTLVALFTAIGVRVQVGSTLQVSGATQNDFTNPVAYTITAADGSTITYSVIVIVAAINLSRTGQTTSYAAGDDGDKKAGIAWPIVRFSIASSGTGTVVTDNLTGLMWTSDANVPSVGACTGGLLTWQGALDYVACLNINSYLGYTDWRLPNGNELRSLINYKQANFSTWLNTQGFTNVLSDTYWSSNTWATNTVVAWDIRMSDGYVFLSNKPNLTNVWPVRGAGITPTVSLPRTGQTTSYAAGDDGDKEAGIAWPIVRFSIASSGTGTVVMDNLTGLIWTANASTPTADTCTGGTLNWQGALDYVSCLNANNYLGYTDWRLPNINELQSLFHMEYTRETSCSGPCTTNAEWLNSQGFSNVRDNFYWSSTTFNSNSTFAWGIDMSFGVASDISKSFSTYAWPVRGGQ